MSGELAGKLLVASPTLLDPNFVRTVVLVVAHGSEEGAVGTILNRPLDVAAAEFVAPWSEFLASPASVYSGGPVQRAVAVGLARRPGVAPTDSWDPVLDGVGFIDLGREPGEIDGVEVVRVFSGYSGWSSGQIEMEIKVGSWFVVPAMPPDPFGAAPEDLWRSVLRRQPDRLAFFADFPDDPRTN